MKVQLLYIEGCPHWRQALRELNDILREHGVTDQVELVRVSSVEEARQREFLGSPTVRINDTDVDSDIPESGYGLACRIYRVEGRAAGKPPREWLAAAVEQALEEA